LVVLRLQFIALEAAFARIPGKMTIPGYPPEGGPLSSGFVFNSSQHKNSVDNSLGE
jgi:hypothetical protein